MKVLHCLTFLLAASIAAPALATDVGVSVTVGQPGFYGQIHLGDMPQPRLIYAEPILIERVQVVRPPMYLRVPPGHAKHWDKHCASYGACGHPVYFVDDDWYETVYVREYSRKHGKSHGHKNHGDHDKGGKGHGGKGHGKGGKGGKD